MNGAVNKRRVLLSRFVIVVVFFVHRAKDEHRLTPVALHVATSWQLSQHGALLALSIPEVLCVCICVFAASYVNK